MTGSVHINADENQTSLCKGDIIFTASSENFEDVGLSSVVTEVPEATCLLNSFCFGLRLHEPESYDLSYLSHLFRSESVRRQIRRSANGVTRINISKKPFLKTKIPVPELKEQEKLGAILDKFDALVNDISSGLPAEIEARRKQYEYYRDKLLTFPELKEDEAV